MFVISFQKTEDCIKEIEEILNDISTKLQDNLVLDRHEELNRILFSKVTLIVNSESSVCLTNKSGNRGVPQRQTKPERTIVICENVTTEIPLMQELPELFNKWKRKQNLI